MRTFLATALTLIATPVLAVSITPEVSTLGYGGSVGFGITPLFGVRVAGHVGTYSRDVNKGAGYDGKLELNNGGALLDLYPFASGFRLTGGVHRPGAEQRLVKQKLFVRIRRGGDKHQIRGFQIPVHEALLFRCGQCAADLQGDLDGRERVKRPGAANAHLQRFAFHEFHRDVDHSVRGSDVVAARTRRRVLNAIAELGYVGGQGEDMVVLDLIAAERGSV